MGEPINASVGQKDPEVFVMEGFELTFELDPEKEKGTAAEPARFNAKDTAEKVSPKVKIPFPRFIDFGTSGDDDDGNESDVGGELRALGDLFAAAHRAARDDIEAKRHEQLAGKDESEDRQETEFMQEEVQDKEKLALGAEEVEDKDEPDCKFEEHETLEKKEVESQACKPGRQLQLSQDFDYLLDRDARFNRKQNNTNQASWPHGRRTREEREKFARLDGDWKYYKHDADLALIDGKWLQANLKHFPGGQASFAQLEEAFLAGKFSDGTEMTYRDSVRIRQGATAHFMQIAGVKTLDGAKIRPEDARRLQKMKGKEKAKLNKA